MFLDIMSEHVEALAKIAPTVDQIIDALDARMHALSKPQALALAGLVMQRRPDLILDLGTGRGASACIFALAAGAIGLSTRIWTFDVEEKMQLYVLQRLTDFDRTSWVKIESVIADIESFDFAPVTTDASNILVFWDAHGYAVASGVLCNLMPLIANKRHLVICHDIADNRISVPLTYDARGFWRGMDDWYAAPEKRARVNIGWAHTVVDQIIPILDFCHRNGVEFHSVDHGMHIVGDAATRSAVAGRLGFPSYEAYAMGYFSLNETHFRNFPVRNN